MGGRIFFKGVRYHGHNETILIHDGYVTWRYWLRRVKDIEHDILGPGSGGHGSSPATSKDQDGRRRSASRLESAGIKSLKPLPCRFFVEARGLEWFIYNRSPAYDAILESISSKERQQMDENVPLGPEVRQRGSFPEKRRDWDSSIAEKQGLDSALPNLNSEKTFDSFQLRNMSTLSTSGSVSALNSPQTTDSTRLPITLNLLPLGIQCSRGAIVMGNENTSSILTAKFDRAHGEINASDSQGMDLYRLSFDFDLASPLVKLKSNTGFSQSQQAAAVNTKTNSGIELQKRGFAGLRVDYHRRMRKHWRNVRNRISYFRGSVESLSTDRPDARKVHTRDASSTGVPGRNQWLGLSRYLDDDEGAILEQERWKGIEYGENSTIVDSPNIGMNFYWDVPGKVLGGLQRRNSSDRFANDINGSEPPGYGLNIVVRGGRIYYGPWADRQRQDLQTMFFPNPYQNDTPAKTLIPGQPRLSTVFNLAVDIEEEVTLVIPTREESKDWQWKERVTDRKEVDSKSKGKRKVGKGKKGATTTSTQDKRSYGWLDIKVGSNSTAGFAMDMVPGSTGFHNQLDLDLRQLEISSSVNHGLLCRLKTQVVSCDLHNPLQWNALRKWTFDLHGDGLELFILRDHIFLMTDLVSDWASGPPSEFHTFVPFEYILNAHFLNFRLYLNVNDNNIINNPSDTDDNTFIIIWGEELVADVDIPLKELLALRNKITFDADARDGGFELLTPAWNSQNTFLDDRNVASLKDLRVDGTYDYYNASSPGLTDTLLLDIHGVAPVLHLHGFLIRYFLLLKENYFGDDLHFRTLVEYQDQLARYAKGDRDAFSQPQHIKPSNDLDVILSIAATDASALLHTSLYNTRDNIRIGITSFAGDLRFTNYYMDVQVSFHPMAITHQDSEISAVDAESNVQMYIDGIQMYGHRLFGLPPTEPTYVCNWDFTVGDITGDCTANFLRGLNMASRCFAFSFGDVENALQPIQTTTSHDVTFLRARVRPIHVWFRVQQAAFLLSLEGVSMDFNDRIGLLFSSCLHIVIPKAIIAVLEDYTDSHNHNQKPSPAHTHAFFETSVKVSLVTRTSNFTEIRQLQQEHIDLHDSRTSRVPWLLHDQYQPSSQLLPLCPSKLQLPAMPFPQMPAPLGSCTARTKGNSLVASSSSRSSKYTRTVNRKRSFLSLSSSRYSMIERDMNARKTSNSNVGDITQGFGSADKLKLGHTSENDSMTTDQRKRSADRRNDAPNLSQPHATHDDGVLISGFGFSSAYKLPYFHSFTMTADTSEVPTFPDNVLLGHETGDEGALDFLEAQLEHQGIAQATFLIDLAPGLKGSCTPEALHQINSIITSLEPKDSVAILDTLQMDSISTVIDEMKGDIGDGTIAEINLRVPHICIRFQSSSTVDTESPVQHEIYDLHVQHLVFTTRFTPNRDQSSVVKQTQQHRALHLKVDELTISAREGRKTSNHDQAVIRCSVQNPSLWFVSGEELNVNLQFGDCRITSASTKVDYMASLLNHTSLIAENLVAEFSKTIEDQRVRLRILILVLTQKSKGIPDPLVLTRASTVLRTSTNHLRSSDSWQMMSYLRYVLQCLPEAATQQITSQIDDAHACPKDAQALVATSFDHWHSWDSSQVRRSHLMQSIYGKKLQSPNEDSFKSLPVTILVKGIGIHFILDPGTHQSEITFQELDVYLQLGTTLTHIVGKTISSEPAGKTKRVQITCEKSVVRLNWNLCELIEDSLRLFNRSEKPASSIATTTQSHGANHQLHVVISSNNSILELLSPNIKSTSMVKGLKTSVISQAQKGGLSKSKMYLIFKANAARTEIHSQSRILTVSRVRQPSLTGAVEHYDDKGIRFRTWKLVGNSATIIHEVCEGPLSIIEAGNKLLSYEIAHISQVAKSFDSVSGTNTHSATNQEQDSIDTITIVLSIKSYVVSILILPSLKYAITGKDARCTAVPDTSRNSNTIINCDLGYCLHIFTTKRNNVLIEVLRLHTPPINGRGLLIQSSESTSLKINLLMEAMHLGATALHALFNTLSGPEIAYLTDDIRNEIGLAEQHYQKIFAADTSKRPRFVKSSKPFKCTLQAVLVELGVEATTPKAMALSQATQLRLKTGVVRFLATNQEFGNRSSLEIPELDIRVRNIRMNLIRIGIETSQDCGDILLETSFRGTSKRDDDGQIARSYEAISNRFEVNLYAETAPTIVELLGHLQDNLERLDLGGKVKSLRKLRSSHSKLELKPASIPSFNAEGNVVDSTALFTSMYSVEMTALRLTWRVGTSIPRSPGREAENLVFSVTKIELATKKHNAARLLIQDLQLELVPTSRRTEFRSLNSALLPEVIFNVAYLSTQKDRRLAFQAVGKALDLRLTSQFIIPASDIRRSIALAVEQSRTAAARWKASPVTESDNQTKNLLGEKKLASLLIDADFAGAVVFIQGRASTSALPSALNVIRSGPQQGRYGQFTNKDAGSNTTLRAPGIAIKIEYKNLGDDDTALNAECKVDASSNILYPAVVPLVLEMSSSVKEIVGETDAQQNARPATKSTAAKFIDEETFRTADPSAIFGSCKLNLGLRICRQEFSLSCQPIARVAATARFEDIYMTVNTVQSAEHGLFYTFSAAFTKLQASVQHVYSRESTADFDVDSVVMSIMDSKHINAANGLSAILKISPMKVLVNARQLQDFLLFREIWSPPDMGLSSTPSLPSEPQAFNVQRYQQVAAASAFPWNATVSIAELDIILDLGQSLGKSSFVISGFWISSKKTSDWEQILCLGLRSAGVDSKGRMNGFIELQDLQVRTSITWPRREQAQNETPLIQASLGFVRLRARAAFDYQAFLVADITMFDFLMYNVRDSGQLGEDRLVGILDGDKVQVYCTATSASQGLALGQAFERLFQEKQAAYEASLRDLEKFMRRKSSVNPILTMRLAKKAEVSKAHDESKTPSRLHTDVVINLRSVKLGAFPSTFYDNQLFRVEALDASARFGVFVRDNKIHSDLGMNLGSFRVALAGISRAQVPKTLGEVSVDDVIRDATNSSGGTILKVPKVVARMQTWQIPELNDIDYIFESSFHGKVDVGWNYSRISFIRAMFATHSRTLAQRLGKPLPQSAVQISGGPKAKGEMSGGSESRDGKEKITATVNVPLSKYRYTALKPPTIQTPQLRDMGEATPPLEWIGLQRERLPNLTHQIVIVALQEVAKEVEDAYSRILGSS